MSIIPGRSARRRHRITTVPVPHVPAPEPDRLPLPAPRSRGCCRCDLAAVLVEPVSGRSYCGGCWMACVVQGQIE